jgi:hypothetical protein
MHTQHTCVSSQALAGIIVDLVHAASSVQWYAWRALAFINAKLTARPSPTRGAGACVSIHPVIARALHLHGADTDDIVYDDIRGTT